MRVKNIQFICIGGGTELDNIIEHANNLNVADYIEFTGMVSNRKRLIELLSSTDICIATDIYNEMNDKSTMNKVMEYMALKKPVVQFDLKEGRRTAGDASLYAKPDDPVDMADKILELINDPKKREQMSQYGYKRMVNEMSWKYEKENLYKAYRRLFSIPEED